MTALACLLAAFLFAEPRRPACPDGKPPRLTGHPMRPAACEAAEGEAAALSPLPDEADASSLDALIGVWKGFAYSGGGRYEIEAEVSGTAKERRLRWTAKSAQTHAVHELLAEVSAGFFSRKQPWKVVVTSPRLTDEKLKGKLRLGAGRAVWTFSGRPGTRSLDFSLEGTDRLKLRYSEVTDGAEPSVLELTLSR